MLRGLLLNHTVLPLILKDDNNNNNKEFILIKNTCHVCFNELNDLLT